MSYLKTVQTLFQGIKDSDEEEIWDYLSPLHDALEELDCYGAEVTKTSLDDRHSTQRAIAL